jgi:hypothetical protein
VISPTIFTMMVLMALTTTFVTSPIVRWLQDGHRVEAPQRGTIAER